MIKVEHIISYFLMKELKSFVFINLIFLKCFDFYKTLKAIPRNIVPFFENICVK